MRKLTPVFIATSVVIALAGTTAQAQVSSGARGTPPSATTSTSSPSAPATMSPSGTAGTTSGASTSGTSSGDAFSGSSRGNAPPVGAAATGTPGSTSTTTTTTQGTPTLTAPGVQVNANGERMFVNPDNGAVVTDTGSASTSSSSNTSNTSNNSTTSNNSSTNNTTGAASTTLGVPTTPELDQATRRELQHQRKTVERKGQMMNSIAPRGGVDRTDQMPDDATPLLSPSRR